MAKREQYGQAIACEKCGRDGSATISEYENPVHSRGAFDSTVVAVSEGFSHSGNTIRCRKCRIIVTEIAREL